MIFKLTRNPGSGATISMKPPLLPCGCRVVGSAQIIGLDGVHIQGVKGVNTKTGWICVMRYVVEPALIKVLEGGRVGTTREGVEPVNCVAPFELRCKTHGKLDEPEVHEKHGRRKHDLCACSLTASAECCAAYGCAYCASALYHRAAEEAAR